MNESIKQQLKDIGHTGEFDLASLITAIGEGQFALSRIPEAFVGWGAVVQDGEKRALGATPEEAVAKLIIALKK